MKWTKKGHEFDDIGKNFVSVDRVYIYGCGVRGMELAKKMSFCDVVTGFIDKRATRFPQGYMGKPVYQQHEFLKINHKNAIVIIAIADFMQSLQIKKTLIYEGFAEGVSLFDDYTFITTYISIYYWYRHKKLCAYSFCRGPYKLGTRLTYKCTLNCKYCNGLCPEIKKGHNDYDEFVVKNMKSLFSKFDYVERFIMLGGETFLYPRLSDCIEHLFSNYPGRFRFLEISTNGFFPAFDEKLVSVMKQYNSRIEIIWSDYRDALKDMSIISRIDENIGLMKDCGFNVIYAKYDHWVDLRLGEKRNDSDDDLKTLFNHCYGHEASNSDEVNLLVDCSMANKIRKYKLGLDEPPGFLNLDKEDNKVLFLEMMLGFTDKGYTEMCRYCGGYFGANENYVTAGEQN